MTDPMNTNPVETTQLDAMAGSISENELPEDFPDTKDVGQWLKSRVQQVSALAKSSTPDCESILKIWHEMQAMLVGMQIRRRDLGLDLIEVIVPLRRLIKHSKRLGKAIRINPAVVSPQMSAQDFVAVIRTLYDEFRTAPKEMPRWCVFKKNVVSRSCNHRDIGSLESGELAEPLKRLQAKLTKATEQCLGNVDCNDDELEIMLILSGDNECPIPKESNVSLPAWLRASRRNAEKDVRCRPFIQSLEEGGAV